jgi:TPR repeat protein
MVFEIMPAACTSITSLLAGMSAPRLTALFAQAPQRAADWVYVAAAEGLAAAQVCYGRMLLEGTGVPKDQRAALAWFQRAAARGDLDAMNMAGRCLDNGWGVAADLPAAAEQYRRAADAGHAWAQYNLGHLYLDGRGVAQDFAQAFAYYHRAARQQHARAMNLVGRCCEEGWGTVRDPASAAAWYRRSAEGGYFRGQYNWATLLLKESRVGEAVPWLECAAAGGSAGVRQAVMQLCVRAGAGGVLRDLADRLQAGAA